MGKVDITQNGMMIGRLLAVTAECVAGLRTMQRKERYSDAWIFILSGNCTYTFDDGVCFTVEAGNILYLPYRASYIMQIRSPEYSYIYCDFMFDDPMPRLAAMYASVYGEEAEKLFRRLYQCHAALDSAAFPECMALLYQIYALAIRWKNSIYLGKTALEKIQQARNYMDVNFHDSALGVQKLAEDAGMSEVYFRKLFKNRYHLSPAQYLIAVRVKKAKELLSYPYLTLEECARQCGFSSVQYFCRVFKMHTGFTPAKYRKNK